MNQFEEATAKSERIVDLVLAGVLAIVLILAAGWRFGLDWLGEDATPSWLQAVASGGALAGIWWQTRKAHQLEQGRAEEAMRIAAMVQAHVALGVLASQWRTVEDLYAWPGALARHRDDPLRRYRIATNTVFELRRVDLEGLSFLLTNMRTPLFQEIEAIDARAYRLKQKADYRVKLYNESVLTAVMTAQKETGVRQRWDQYEAVVGPDVHDLLGSVTDVIYGETHYVRHELLRVWTVANQEFAAMFPDADFTQLSPSQAPVRNVQMVLVGQAPSNATHK
jgi:hypothetical protein